MYGEKLKKLRKNAGLNQADIARITGVSRPNVSFWEKAEYPPLEAIVKICKALNVELHDFFRPDIQQNTKEALLPREYNLLIKNIEVLPPAVQQELLKIMLQVVESFSVLKAAPQPLKFEAEVSVHDIDSFMPTSFARKAGYHAMEQYFSRLTWIAHTVN